MKIDSLHTPKSYFQEVVFMDGRNHELSLDANSFELTKCETSLSNSDFYEEDKQKITNVYYKEMAECVKEKLGAEHVKVFHHQVRNKERNTGKPNVINTNIQGYCLNRKWANSVSRQRSYFQWQTIQMTQIYALYFILSNHDFRL